MAHTTSPLRQSVRSIESQVYELIRDRIVRAEYAPGSKLLLIPLSEELQVSTMPVRSALKRLSSEGLVAYRPNKGATVEPLELSAFLELQEIRIAIEVLAARTSARVAPPAVIAEMRAILQELQTGTLDLEESIALEWQGYLVCYRASGMPRLVDLILEHGRLVERYSRAAIGEVFDRETSAAEYTRLIDACEARDEDAAQQAVEAGLRRHIKALSAQLHDKETE
ncbi:MULTISPECIES: GntR family transcriptional regulator [Streptomyces]|uniref:GntR family transcriptional regulator n=1 Tax=Streptomyces TaxID=1883 RepID=UPI00136C9A49|nr:GntR family transcriptional regulator [Streptomyces sp. SID2888]MYV50766.1 FCD domain-containing protein [Streptomyces sp. SID2888]